ncbi:hypothetical protein A3Q56_08651, partial [Intoshia linei]
MGVIKTETRAYHHEGVGGVERLIRDRNISEILLSMRNTMNQASGRSPAQLVYDRNLRLPVDGRVKVRNMLKRQRGIMTKRFLKVVSCNQNLRKLNRKLRLSMDVDPLVVEDNKLNSDTEVVPVKTVSDKLKREFAFMKIDVVEEMCLYLTLSQFDNLRYHEQ